MNVERGLSHLRVGKIMKKKVQNKFETVRLNICFFMFCFLSDPIISYHVKSSKKSWNGSDPPPPFGYAKI